LYEQDDPIKCRSPVPTTFNLGQNFERTLLDFERNRRAMEVGQFKGDEFN